MSNDTEGALRAEVERSLGMVNALTAELLLAGTRERDAKAAAWDEGALAGLAAADWEYGDAPRSEEPAAPNPYRAAEVRS